MGAAVNVTMCDASANDAHQIHDATTSSDSLCLKLMECGNPTPGKYSARTLSPSYPCHCPFTPSPPRPLTPSVLPSLQRPEMVRLKEEIQRAQKRLDADVARLEELRAAREEQSRTVGQLERQMEDVSAQLEEVRGRGSEAKRELELGQVQMAEYNKR